MHGRAYATGADFLERNLSAEIQTAELSTATEVTGIQSGSPAERNPRKSIPEKKFQK